MMKQGSRLHDSTSITGPPNLMGIMTFGSLKFVHVGRED